VFGKLHLCTADGRVLSLDPSPYDVKGEKPGSNLYEELCPVYPLVVSALPPSGFLKFLTDPKNPIHVPRLFFVDMLLDRDENGMLAGYLPYPDPFILSTASTISKRGATRKPRRFHAHPVTMHFSERSAAASSWAIRPE